MFRQFGSPLNILVDRERFRVVNDLPTHHGEHRFRPRRARPKKMSNA